MDIDGDCTEIVRQSYGDLRDATTSLPRSYGVLAALIRSGVHQNLHAIGEKKINGRYKNKKIFCGDPTSFF